MFDNVSDTDLLITWNAICSTKDIDNDYAECVYSELCKRNLPR